MSNVVQLRQHKRMRRTPKRPGFIDDALLFRSQKRWRTHTFPGSNVALRCHSKAKERVGDYVYAMPEEEQGWVKRQSRFGLIEIEGEQVGALEAVRYETDVLICTEEFVLIMDMDSAYEAALGVVLGNAWENIGLDVTDFGTIVELRWAWVEPTASVDVPLTKLFETMLRPWLSTHAIMVLKAFPLEYEGYRCAEEKEEVDYEVAFRRRRRALMRMFAREGFESFPGKTGHDGWMLRVADRVEGMVTPPGQEWLNEVMR
ncbi:MAG: hypothetical protein AAF437_04075 [Pseudomonadota bacterium]